MVDRTLRVPDPAGKFREVKEEGIEIRCTLDDIASWRSLSGGCTWRDVEVNMLAICDDFAKAGIHGLSLPPCPWGHDGPVNVGGVFDDIAALQEYWASLSPVADKE